VQLLVSVSDGIEAAEALNGGADIVDAKDPSAGPLGAVSPEGFDRIRRVVGDARPVTAALGDAHDCRDIEASARDYACRGAWLVKVGLAGIGSAARAFNLFEAAVRGVSQSARDDRAQDLVPGVIAVAYADASLAASVPPDRLIAPAARAGARGILLDTFDKSGPGLRELMTIALLEAWVRSAKAEGLLVALAGRLSANDLPWVGAAGADVVGVRGAACEGGRAGRVTSTHVRRLRSLCERIGDATATI
jgi:uncharacterized protein (UPF0264 family)